MTPDRDQSGRFKEKHGDYGSPEYAAWNHMKARCGNPKHRQYADYGGRGIQVIPRWIDYNAFLEDMGRRPSKNHSLDRRDNKLGYFKENCRWATTKEQNRNNRRNRLLTHNGKTQCIVAWAEEIGVAHSVIQCRISRGWTTERALSTRRREYPDGVNQKNNTCLA